MKPVRDLRERQKATVFAVLIFFGAMLIVLQLWLFVAVLENMLAGHTAMAIPAALASVVILLVNVWMLRGVYRLDRAP